MEDFIIQKCLGQALGKLNQVDRVCILWMCEDLQDTLGLDQADALEVLGAVGRLIIQEERVNRVT